MMRNISLLFSICCYVTTSLQELIKGENIADSDDDEQDFDSWEPDPVDANPSECLKQSYCNHHTFYD